ncbi:hypothetical protein K431DRAFT_295147 [Polychaeton citri CBS 116435]|uniref:CCHC-type domain-containing protein n=1 Tax=Polychaeton citri CBS 116435 TaxID=1314669 RepID=A0A9P4UPH4_9PEZI|nr:hypothetical protein K431DRAFT_295147 [Polychaeton citri CBS 116435]
MPTEGLATVSSLTISPDLSRYDNSRDEATKTAGTIRFACASVPRLAVASVAGHRTERVMDHTWSAGSRIYHVKLSDKTGCPQLFYEERRMSSLSRRACYKCGNVGHYAEVCSSSERLCYNCKQPGHESNTCPHPRTSESKPDNTEKPASSDGVTDTPKAKQCYHCQGLGHVQADCPTLRLNGGTGGGRCYSCGQVGHLARNCSAPNSAAPAGRGAGAPRGGYAGGYGRGGMVQNNRAATCYKCGEAGHISRECPQAPNEASTGPAAVNGEAAVVTPAAVPQPEAVAVAAAPVNATA